MVSQTHIVLVRVMMEVAAGGPTARLAPCAVFAVGRKAPRFPDKAERSQRGEPIEPLRRIGDQLQFSLLRTQQQVAPLTAVFHQCCDARACTLIGWMERPSPTAQHFLHCRPVIAPLPVALFSFL